LCIESLFSDMIRDIDPTWQALLGTLLTWGLTMAGAAGVFFVPQSASLTTQRKFLDASLGFAAGVMMAASYWSLLAPAIEIAEESGLYGAEGQWAFVPVAFGFLLGGAFVMSADRLLPHESELMGVTDVQTGKLEAVAESEAEKKEVQDEQEVAEQEEDEEGEELSTSKLRRRKAKESLKPSVSESESTVSVASKRETDAQSWRRIILLVIAITVHNFPEGLAVGVGFGAAAQESLAAGTNSTAATKSSHTFESACSLAVGIGLQNFPEGLAVSLPLLRLGYSPFKSFWYGQLSGMVEPLAGVMGAFAISVMSPLLPYALAFAAGAMIFVVVHDLVPEAHKDGNGDLASIGAMIGFVVMMCMDVGLG